MQILPIFSHFNPSLPFHLTCPLLYSCFFLSHKEAQPHQPSHSTIHIHLFPSHSSTYTAAPYRFQRIIRYHVYNHSGFPDSIFQVRCSSGIPNHERLVLNIYQSIHHIIRFLDMCNPYPVFCMVILHFNYG